MWPTFKENRQMAISVSALLILGSIFLAVKTIQTIATIDTIGEPVPYEHQISIEGTGKASMVPNIAMVDVGLTTKGKNVADVQRENSEKTNNLMKLIAEKGIKSDDMKTTNYNLSQWVEWNNTTMVNEEKGWIITQNLQLKIRDLEKVSEILDIAGQNGSTSINGPTFVVDDMTKLKAEARQLAIADAKAKAKKLADDLGMDIGEIVSYYEYTENNPMPMYGGVSMMKDGMGSGGMMESAPSIAAGTNEVIINVNLGYILED